MDIYEFAAEVVRPLNIALGLVASVWFTFYISRGWARLPNHFKRLALVMILLLYSTLFSAAESYLQSVPGGSRVFMVTFAFSGTLYILWKAQRRGHKAGDTIQTTRRN
jgi:hypothetical protein